MFLKQSSSGFAYLEKFAESAIELKNFIDDLKTRFDLPEDSGLLEIQDKIEQLFSEWINKSDSAAESEEIILQLRNQNNKLISEVAEKNLTANISSYMLYEVLEHIKTLLNSRKDFLDEADYFNHVILVLNKLKDAEILKYGDVISEKSDEITRLKNALEMKIEAYSLLKLQVAELFSDGCAPNLSNFEKNFGKFQKELMVIKEKAAKYDFLIARGAIKEVGNDISSSGHFYLHYGK